MGSATASKGVEGTLSPRWEAALLEFARDQDRRGAAAATKKAYASDLSELAGWASARGSEPGELRYRDLRGFAAELSGRGLAKSSIGRKLAAVRTFHAHLVDVGMAESNPADLLPTPKSEQRLPRTLGCDDVAVLLDRIPVSTPAHMLR
jgi:integrase/recombinase XerC